MVSSPAVHMSATLETAPVGRTDSQPAAGTTPPLLVMCVHERVPALRRCSVKRWRTLLLWGPCTCQP